MSEDEVWVTADCPTEIVESNGFKYIRKDVHDKLQAEVKDLKKDYDNLYEDRDFYKNEFEFACQRAAAEKQRVFESQAENTLYRMEYKNLQAKVDMLLDTLQKCKKLYWSKLTSPEALFQVMHIAGQAVEKYEDALGDIGSGPGYPLDDCPRCNAAKIAREALAEGEE